MEPFIAGITDDWDGYLVHMANPGAWGGTCRGGGAMAVPGAWVRVGGVGEGGRGAWGDSSGP